MSGSGIPRVVLAGESWAPIPDHDGWEVSSEGRVWSRPRYRTRGGMLARFETSRGYLAVKLGQKTVDVHRIVASAFLGPCPDGLEVRHLDGDATNPRLSNLAYGTKVENRLDRLAHGTDHNANKTHCPKGHPYDTENTYVNPSRPTARYCRACRRDSNREGMRRKRAQDRAM